MFHELVPFNPNNEIWNVDPNNPNYGPPFGRGNGFGTFGRGNGRGIGGTNFIHIPNYGKRKVRYQKNGRAYVIVKGKKLKLN